MPGSPATRRTMPRSCGWDIPRATARPMDDVHGITVTGGTLPTEIWHRSWRPALADVPPDKFPDPPLALLAPPTTNAMLTVAPVTGDRGSTVTADGTGYNQCVANWYVTVGASQSAPQPGATDDHRSTAVVVPADAPPGPADVQAWCDTARARKRSPMRRSPSTRRQRRLHRHRRHRSSNHRPRRRRRRRRNRRRPRRAPGTRRTRRPRRRPLPRP